MAPRLMIDHSSTARILAPTTAVIDVPGPDPLVASTEMTVGVELAASMGEIAPTRLPREVAFLLVEVEVGGETGRHYAEGMTIQRRSKSNPALSA